MAVVAVAALVGLGRLEDLDGDGAAAVLVQGPLGDVEVVGTPVGHLAAGVLVPPAELVVAVRLVALLAIGDLRGRAEPEVPVQALGDGRLRERAARRVAADAALDGLDLADAAGADQLDRQAEHAAELGALLAAGLQDAAGVLDHLLDRQRLGDGQRQRLLAVDVLAGLERLDGDLGVPVVGRGDEQAVERLVVDEVAVVLGVGLEVLEPSLAHHLGGALAMGGVHVAAEREGQLSRLARWGPIRPRPAGCGSAGCRCRRCP